MLNITLDKKYKEKKMYEILENSNLKKKGK